MNLDSLNSTVVGERDRFGVEKGPMVWIFRGGSGRSVQKGNPSESAATRADYVVSRLTEVVTEPNDEDWGLVRRELAWAFDAIDDAQQGEKQRTVVRRVVGTFIAYVVIAILHWQLDSHWSTRGVSLSTAYLPILAAVAAVFVVMVYEGLDDLKDAFAHLLRRRSFFFFDTESFVFVALGVSVLGAAFIALHAVFDYGWPQAIVILVVEPFLWLFIFAFVTSLSEVPRPAADPRDQLVADLSTFLAILAVPLNEERFHQDWRGEGKMFPPLRWANMTYSVAEQHSRQSKGDDGLQMELSFPHKETSADPLPDALRVRPGIWYWRQDRMMRRALADGIEVSADRVESALPKALSRNETAVRSSVQHISAKIAATLRSYAVDVALGGEGDHSVPSRISSALVAAARGSWSSLALEEPQPVVERFLKRFGVRIAVAVVLVVVAIVAPLWMGEWIGEASTQFRIALITAAIVGLTEAPKTAVDRLATYFAGRQS